MKGVNAKNCLRARFTPRTGCRDFILCLLGLTVVAYHDRSATWAAEVAGMNEVSPRIVNGEPTFAYPETGALLFYEDASGAVMNGLCSGTLVGCHTFLTAAHCVCPNRAWDAAACARRGPIDPATLRVFLPHGGTFAVANISVSPTYQFAAGGDVAVVTLADEVTGIVPAGINTTGRLALGTSATIVGFGTTVAGRGTPDYAGIKRVGTVRTGECPSDVPGTQHICYSFTGSGANTCEGDSGGPMFADLGAGSVLAGITSGGNSFDCLAPDLAFDTDVYVNRTWIQSTAGPLSENTSCGLPAVGSVSTAVVTAAFQLTGTVPESTLAIKVAPGTAVLRVALNGQLGSSTVTSVSNDFDLYVGRDQVPTTTAYDCADTTPAPLAFCEIRMPPAGTWHAMVRREQGDGLAQLTATTFGTGTPGCAGDCNADGSVTVDELLEGVRIALGEDDLALCPSFDSDRDQLVTVDEVLHAVGLAIDGCTAP
ncbi:trypsin-like serine protease [Candidatus Binatia bacterium]|nr:trypsin-like serine protease [Candidatus Binatia bacterium]